jgi:hypothetical protein
MKVLITALGLALMAYSFQKGFASAQKESERDVDSVKTFLNGNKGQAKSFIANTSNYIFLNTEKRNSIVLPNKVFVTKNSLPVRGSIDVEMKANTTAGEIIQDRVQKPSDGYHLLPAEDFLFVSLIMMN